MVKHRLLWLGLSAGVTGCDLSETTIPEGEEVVAVHAVMRPDRPQQFILVERSLTGARFTLPDTADVPPARPKLALKAATVTVENLNVPDDPCGSPVAFIEADAPAGDVSRDGVYWAPRGCPTMNPGDQLALRVEAPNGDVVTGTMTVPSLTDAFVRTRTDSTSLGQANLSFNRDTDTLHVGVVGPFGRGLQVSVRTLNVDSSSGIPTAFVVDTTHVRLPGGLLTLADSARGSDVFRAGRTHLISVARSDQNYFDFARSTNGAITGRGFISHLQGGIGVFGSLVVRMAGLRVVGNVDDSNEGLYRLSGTLDGSDIDMTWEIYVGRIEEDVINISSFIRGIWINGVLDTSVDGVITDGAFASTVMSLTGPIGLAISIEKHRLVARSFSTTSPFAVDVTDLGDTTMVGTLTMQRVGTN